jgi:hypothetical protein
MKLADFEALRRLREQFYIAQFCLRHKRRYPTAGAALAAMRSLQRRTMDRPEEGALNVYKCRRCLAWHVGHRGSPNDSGRRYVRAVHASAGSSRFLSRGD